MCALEMRTRYARVAPFYDLLDVLLEPLYARGRRLIGAMSVGLTLELGAGTGKNFSYYAADARVIALDVSWAMLARSRRRIPPPIRGFLVADVHDLPVREASVDSVVATFVCCVQGDPRPALYEIARVLRPSGKALFMEYVLPSSGWLRRLLRGLEPLLHAVYGVSWQHDLMMLLPATGFDIVKRKRIWGPLITVIVAERRPHGEDPRRPFRTERRAAVGY